MVNTINDLTTNQVADTVAIWDRIEERFTNRYGKELLSDPSFIKAKEQIFQQIIDHYKNRNNNFAEKAELKMLQAQKRAMIRQRYPNGIFRLGRNTAVLSANLAVATLKLSWRFVKGVVRSGRKILTELSRPVQSPAIARTIGGGLLADSEGPGYGPRNGARQPDFKAVLGQAQPTQKNNQRQTATTRHQQPRRNRNTPATNKGKTVRR